MEVQANMKVYNPNNLPTIPIADLIPTQGDLKDLTETNYNKLKSRIEKRGFRIPVYVWEDNKQLKLLDGHQRQRVLTTEGWTEPIPYLKITAKDLTEAMELLLEIASQYGTTTQEGVDQFIARYKLPEADVYEATSFDSLGSYGADEKAEVEEDEAPEVSSEPPVSKLGEIYQLGRHRVMCGDSTDKLSVELLMDGVKADMVFTDPPYGVDYSGGIQFTKNGVKKEQRERLADDHKTTDIYSRVVPLIPSFTSGAVYMWFADTQVVPVYQAVEQVGDIHALIIWVKNGGYSAMNANYKQKHEPCLYWKPKNGKLNFVGKSTETTIWELDKDGKNEYHPTQKPVALSAKAIQNHNSKNVLDLFLESGSTLIACEQTDRTCYGMELDPKYVDVIRKRYAKFTNNNELPDNWEELTAAISDEKQTESK
jgi:site-specific DNA-methyltransferase (adenine-specific)